MTASGVVLNMPDGDVMYPVGGGSWVFIGGGGAVEGGGRVCGRVW